MEDEVEGTYEYECMRAELLGLDKPDYDEWMKNHPSQQAVEDEQLATEILKDADATEEGLRNISGGLGELNTILSATQKKLNRFKATCGSLTNLLKIKVGHGSNESIARDGEQDSMEQIKSEREVEKNVTTADKLDALLNQAEKAELSMSQQNKQMKKFLNR